MITKYYVTDARGKEVNDKYQEQFEEDIYYIAFEKQGYEQLIVKVKAYNEDDAYNKANDTYISDSIDRYTVESKNLWRYDCPIVDQYGHDISDEIIEEEEEGGEE